MSGNFIVRPVVAGDIEEVLDIADECRLSQWSADAYAAETLREDAMFYGARAANDLVGFVLGRFVRSSSKLNLLDAEIFNIGVRPETRRFGVGGLLINHFMNACVSRSVNRVWLEARSSNQNAVSFYEKHNFVISHRRKGYYSAPLEDAIVMTRELSVLKPTIF